MTVMSMRHRVDIYSESSDDGDAQPEYTIFKKNVPCNVVPVSGGEVYRGRQIEADINYAVDMRWLASLSPMMKLVYGSKTLFVERIMESDGRQRYVTMFCTERQV